MPNAIVATIRDTARGLGLAVRFDRPRTAAILALAAAGGILPVLVTWLTKRVVDSVADHGGGAAIAMDVAALLAATALAAMLPALARLVEADLGRHVSLGTRDLAFDRLNGFGGLRHFEDPDFQNRLHLGLEGGGEVPVRLVSQVAQLVQSAVLLVGYSIALVTIDWRAAALVLATGVPHLRAELVLGRRRHELRSELTPVERLGMLYQFLQSDTQAAKEVRLYGLGDFLRTRMTGELRRAQRAECALDRRAFRIRVMLDALGLVPLAACLALAATQAASGELTAGDVVLYIASVGATAAATRQAAINVATLRELGLTLGRFHTLVTTPPDVRRGTGEAPDPLQRLEVRDVWFRYRSDLPWVLRGVDLVIDGPESVAIVGANGAGKSTLVKLLTRLYDPDRGAILWNGVDLRDLDVDALRTRIGAVFQDFVSYDLSVADNVGLGDLARREDRAALGRAVDLVGLTAAIEALPRGLDTRLSRIIADEPDPDGDPTCSGDSSTLGGGYLSGGQWQRLAIARMLMRADRDLLILDEPSSGLDPRAEFELHETVSEHTVGRARVLVSHRLNTIRSADRIVVLEDGVVTEDGDHARLMAAAGTYAGLFELQRRGFD